jgi:chromosome segregation ATPase
LEILQRRQLIDPLPESAQGILDILNGAIRGDAVGAVISAEVQNADRQAVAPHDEVKEERITRQHAGDEALTRSYERPREPESAAAARAAALAADLAAAQAAAAAGQRRARELDAALAEKNAAAEASRTRVDEILRDYGRLKDETRALRDSLAARDTTIVQLRHSLDERETQLAALQREHAEAVSALAARAAPGAQLKADRQAALARAEAISAELKVSQEAAAELEAQLKRSESRLNAALAELDAAKSQSGSYLELLRTRAWRRGFDHATIRQPDAKAGAATAGHHALESERDRLQGRLAAADSERERLAAELATRDRALLQAQERATSDAQRVAELTEAAVVVEAEQAAQIAQLRAEQAAKIERLQAEADQHLQEMGVLMARLQEAPRPVQSLEADLKRLAEELAAKDEKLAAAGADPGAAASGPADRPAELVRIDGGETTTYVLAKRTRIGRAADCEVRVDSTSVSRHHALVVVGLRDTVIEDLNSTNGVLVNGRRVTRHVLCDGDSLTLGETRYCYFARPPDGPLGTNPAR